MRYSSIIDIAANTCIFGCFTYASEQLLLGYINYLGKLETIVKSYFSTKFIVIIMLMLSLIGQSSASVMMSCDMMNMSDMPMPHSMNSAEHPMDMSMDMPMKMAMDDSTSTNMSGDCCQENCDCAMASCQSNSYTNNLMTLTITPIPTKSNSLSIALPQEQFLNYLFKPPIS
jgi:hypothetical protein